MVINLCGLRSKDGHIGSKTKIIYCHSTKLSEKGSQSTVRKMNTRKRCTIDLVHYDCKYLQCRLPLHTVPTTPVLTKHSKERRFLYFNHLSKEFLEQMIPHLKALIQGAQNLQKNWLWHHFEAGYAPLTEKALLLLKLVWSLS